MTFTTNALTGGRVLVRGQDSTGTNGETVLDGTEWAQAKAQAAHFEAHEGFDAAVEEFFAPLVEAAEKLESSLAMPALDRSSYFVIDEGEEATPGRSSTVIKLGRDSVILRLIEEGQSDRLVWVAGDLEVLEVLPGTSTSGSVQGQSPEPHELNTSGELDG
jgi:hypothetical protein